MTVHVLHVGLIAVICSSEIFVANGSAPVTASEAFALAEHDEHQAVPHRVIASTISRSKGRCAVECLKKDICRQFCYGKTTGQCVLEDASFVEASVRATVPGADNCTYYTKQGCSSTYYLYPYQRMHPFLKLSFDGETVLDFAVIARDNAVILFSSDNTVEGMQYQLVLGNNETFIREFPSSNPSYTVPSPGVLSETEFRRFWLRYDRGTFVLGKHRKPAYLRWTKTSPISRYFSFFGFENSTTWVLYHTCPLA
ncbi:uncharacterized protein LOC119736830 [Patiria miniata]|uniref:Apple domain-containing protein n=1 Tax=Patiria miniata TaxID=46514 RepID=A0A914ASY1_PATMI|nr:uncharacterized protein LOC119736830 [Patiria miniata]